MAIKYTKEKLAGKSLGELRTIAKKLGVNPSGKNAADLIREIVKASKGAAGKGTAADPKAKTKRGKPGRKASKDDDEEDEEEEDEEEDEEEEEDEDEADDEDEEEEEEEDDDSDDDEEEEEEEDDDEEEEDEDEEDEPKKGKVAKSPLAGVIDSLNAAVKTLTGLAKKGVTAAAGKKGGKATKSSESLDERTEDDEDGDEVRLTPETLAEMDLEQLKEVAETINDDKDIRKAAKGKKIDTDSSSPRDLRKRIMAHLKKYGEGIESDDEEEEDDEESNAPEFARIGAKVKVWFGDEDDDEDEGEWVAGTIESIDEEEEQCHVQLDDGGEADAPWSSLKPLNKRPKKRG